MAEVSPAVSALIGAGSNLGDRHGHLRAALAALAQVPGVSVTAVSRVYSTAPWGLADQPDFLNLVAALETSLAPHDLLLRMLAIETARGRVRSGPRYGPRTLDLDLLFVGNTRLDSPDLTLPHPRWRERPFVVWPLRGLLDDPRFTNHLGWKDLREELGGLDAGPEPASEPFN